ncbi:DUF6157 family protein [Microbacterium gorillae]|uniref:DUF6157 family protein n=1 Tax=Microbacterium gorillae TaxID=1231063 RepID=UPI0005901C02|nr:DUF6157 family protein [Microbacterium gorillae]
MHTTNYVGAFIEVSPDTKAAAATEPPSRGSSLTVAEAQYRLLSEHPYEFTSDDVLFTVHADRAGIADADRPAAREAFFAKGQACLRASPLSKTYGWGTHHDADGRVALVPMESEEYARLAADPALKHHAAMRSARA